MVADAMRPVHAKLVDFNVFARLVCGRTEDLGIDFHVD